MVLVVGRLIVSRASGRCDSAEPLWFESLTEVPGTFCTTPAPRSRHAAPHDAVPWVFEYGFDAKMKSGKSRLVCSP